MRASVSVEEVNYLLYTFICGNCNKTQVVKVHEDRIVIECCKISYGFSPTKIVDATEFLD